MPPPANRQTDSAQRSSLKVSRCRRQPPPRTSNERDKPVHSAPFLDPSFPAAIILRPSRGSLDARTGGRRWRVETKDQFRSDETGNTPILNARRLADKARTRSCLGISFDNRCPPSSRTQGRDRGSCLLSAYFRRKVALRKRNNR